MHGSLIKLHNINSCANGEISERMEKDAFGTVHSMCILQIFTKYYTNTYPHFILCKTHVGVICQYDANGDG